MSSKQTTSGTSLREYEPVEEDGNWEQDDEELLPRRPRRRLLAPVPVALGAILMLACGFIGGVEVEKGQSSSSGGRGGSFGGAPAGRAANASRGSGSARTGGSASGFGALTGGAGSAGVAGAGSAGVAGAGSAGVAGAVAAITAGEVSFVRGMTLYVANSQGNTVKVTAAAGSKITKTVSGSVRDIHPGETVVVRGSQGRSGSIDASSINIGGGIGALLGGSGAGGGSGLRERNAGGSNSSGGGPALFGGN